MGEFRHGSSIRPARGQTYWAVCGNGVLRWLRCAWVRIFLDLGLGLWIVRTELCGFGIEDGQ